MQKHRPVRGIAFPFLVGIGVLALAIATIAAFIPATSSLAAEGDGTQLFGGPTAGAAGTVSLSGPGDSKQYVVSAVVPADTNGGYPPNLGGAHIHLDYDESKVTATCQVGTLQSISCNPDNAGKVTIAFAQVSNQGGQGVGVTSAGNPTTIATITFTAKAGVQNTADAIVARQLVDCRNGNNEHLNCSTNFGALAIGGGGGPEFPWGDLNCSGAVDAVDIAGVKREAAGLVFTRPQGCTMPSDLNCLTGTDATDIALEKRIAAGLLQLQDCRP